MTGDEIRTARDVIGWSRRQLGEALGLSHSQVWAAEMKGPKPEHIEMFDDFVQKAADRTPSVRPAKPLPKSKTPAPEVKTDEVSETEWMGLVNGQICRLNGPHGIRVKFGRHIKTPTQEFVEVFSLKNGGAKCVMPDRIWGPNGQVVSA